MASRGLVAFLVTGMLVTGVINTLLNKLQDLQCVKNCDGEDKEYFEQPVLQTAIMFIVSEQTPELSGFSLLLFWIPTLCDLTATTLMNVGLIYTPASVYQMLRGSVVLFTGTFSVLFLNRRHPMYRWWALLFVFIGVGIVGLSGLSASSIEKTNPLGIFLVILAQTFTASQFVLEELILSRRHIAPLKAVGLEGLFGLISLILIVPAIYFTTETSGGYFDIPEGWNQLVQNNGVLYSGIGIIFSIAFFNYFGLNVTKFISATSRSTIDTSRTLGVWMVSLALGWEKFRWLQVIGFMILIYGTFLFNDVVRPPAFCRPKPNQLVEEVHVPAATRDVDEE